MFDGGGAKPSPERHHSLFVGTARALAQDPGLGFVSSVDPGVYRAAASFPGGDPLSYGDSGSHRGNASCRGCAGRPCPVRRSGRRKACGHRRHPGRRKARTRPGRSPAPGLRRMGGGGGGAAADQHLEAGRLYPPAAGCPADLARRLRDRPGGGPSGDGIPASQDLSAVLSS